MNPLTVLGRYTRTRVPPTRGGSICELCSTPLPEEARHDHLVDIQRRTLTCACRACALLFDRPGAAQRRYKAVPRRVVVDPRVQLADEDWDALEIPVRLAFVFHNSAAQRWVAVYPGAAGATESTLPLQAWDELASRHRMLRSITPDVEALLVHGERGTPLECLLVPIDVCYELVALVRRHWEGFDGGRQFREQLEYFLGELKARSRPFDGGRR